MENKNKIAFGGALAGLVALIIGCATLNDPIVLAGGFVLGMSLIQYR
jgi:hypothetical protein